MVRRLVPLAMAVLASPTVGAAVMLQLMASGWLLALQIRLTLTAALVIVFAPAQEMVVVTARVSALGLVSVLRR